MNEHQKIKVGATICLVALLALNLSEHHDPEVWITVLIWYILGMAVIWI